jgi:hypothetical protein
METPAMALPSIDAEICERCRLSPADFFRRGDCAMHALEIEVVLKSQELAFKVNGVPEQRLVEEFSPDRPDQAFDEGMRDVSMATYYCEREISYL